MACIEVRGLRFIGGCDGPYEKLLLHVSAPARSFAREPAAAIGRKAALLKEAFWGPNPDITIAFLEGSADLRERVKKADGSGSARAARTST